MTYRAYLMPMEMQLLWTDPETLEEKWVRGARYMSIAGPWSIVDLGDLGDDSCIFVGDVTDPEHATIAADTDCTVIPQNLDDTVAGNMTAVQNALEARHIPSGWVEATMTFRDVLRSVIGVSLFLQRLSGSVVISNRKLFSGATLSTQIRDVPADIRSAMTTAADNLGIDRTGINQNSTIRTVLERAATWGRSRSWPVGTQSI